MAKLADAQRLAEELLEQMKPNCERIIIAGSIRRGKPEVKDIELCAIPKFQMKEKESEMFDLFAGLNPEYVNTNLLHFWAVKQQTNIRWIKPGTSKIVSWQPKTDGKYWRGLVAMGDEQIKLDLFLMNADNWGVISTIRTGPAEFSEALVTFIKNKTPFRVEKGHLTIEETKEIIPCAEEEQFFENAGIEFVPVARRSAVNPYGVLKILNSTRSHK